MKILLVLPKIKMGFYHFGSLFLLIFFFLIYNDINLGVNVFLQIKVV